LAPDMSASLQATLAAHGHLGEGQFLSEEQTLNKAKSLIIQIVWEVVDWINLDQNTSQLRALICTRQ
jgi:hypothetical protein